MLDIRECYVCGSQDITHYASFDIHQYIQCSQCGLVYLEKMPSESDIYKAYSGGWFKSFRRKVTAPFRRLENLSGYAERVSDFKSRLQFLSAYSSEIGSLYLLDIGCNKCFLLEAAIQLGYHNVSGIELVPELTIQFQRKYPQYANNIYHSDFSELDEKIGIEIFDIITAFDLVEHLRKPQVDFKKIFNLLKEEGIFIFQTPNTNSKEAKQMKREWGALKPYEHYHLFNEINIEQLGTQVGFSKIEIISDDILLKNGDMIVIMLK